MNSSSYQVSTGLPGLDEVINSLRIGDNVVWQITDIKDYKKLVECFVKQALEDEKRVVYLKFALHEPLITDNNRVVIYKDCR